MSYWLAVGPPDNWAFCFENGDVWGFSTRYENTWRSMVEDDGLLCYATSPVRSVIAYCTVRSKERADQLFFPQEVKQNRLLWPLRIGLAREKLVPRSQWGRNRVSIESRGVARQKGLQRLATDKAEEMLEELRGSD